MAVKTFPVPVAFPVPHWKGIARAGFFPLAGIVPDGGSVAITGVVSDAGAFSNSAPIGEAGKLTGAGTAADRTHINKTGVGFDARVRANYAFVFGAS